MTPKPFPSTFQKQRTSSTSLFKQNQPRTFFRSYNREKNEIDVGKFSLDVYLDAKGFILTSHNNDKSARAGFIKPPKGFSESEDSSIRFYYTKTYVGKSSLLTINFKEDTGPLSEYAMTRRDKFFEIFPSGNVYEVTLDPSVIAHFTERNLESKAILFDSIVLGGNEVLAKLVLYVKTPGGFWELSWHSHMSTILERQDDFTSIVKEFKVVLNEEENEIESTLPETNQIASTSKAMEAEKMMTSAEVKIDK